MRAAVERLCDIPVKECDWRRLTFSRGLDQDAVKSVALSARDALYSSAEAFQVTGLPGCDDGRRVARKVVGKDVCGAVVDEGSEVLRWRYDWKAADRGRWTSSLC